MKATMFIERGKTKYRGHIFIDGERVNVTTCSEKVELKNNMEWAVQAFYDIDPKDIVWLTANTKKRAPLY